MLIFHQEFYEELAASTVESTPPLKANSTSSLISSFTNESICWRISVDVQFCSIPHISIKFFIIKVPFSVCVTSDEIEVQNNFLKYFHMPQ